MVIIHIYIYIIYIYMIYIYIYDIYIYIYDIYIYSMVLQDRDEGKLLLDLSVFTDPPQPYQAAMAWWHRFFRHLSIHIKMYPR